MENLRLAEKVRNETVQVDGGGGSEHVMTGVIANNNYWLENEG